MNRSLQWKLIAVLVLVFLAGIACGFFGALHRTRWIVASHHPAPIAEHLKRRLQWELKLTPQQVEQISPIIDSAAAQLQATREQTMQKVHVIFQQSHREIVPFLSAEQRQKMQEMEERHLEELHRRGFLSGPPP
jgi:ADP-glucose pyrophosphorylase